jgi:hypothetical protein
MPFFLDEALTFVWNRVRLNETLLVGGDFFETVFLQVPACCGDFRVGHSLVACTVGEDHHRCRFSYSGSDELLL